MSEYEGKSDPKQPTPPPEPEKQPKPTPDDGGDKPPQGH